MHRLLSTAPQQTDSTSLGHTPEEGANGYEVQTDSLPKASSKRDTLHVAAAPPAYLTAQGAKSNATATQVRYTPLTLDSLVHILQWPLTKEAQALGLHTRTTLTAQQPGQRLGYSLRTDSWVSGTILLTFFLAAYTIARSLRFLRQQFKDFFRLRERANLFAHSADHHFSGRFYLLAQLSFIVALIYFDYSTTLFPQQLLQVSPYLLITTGVGVALAYNLLKLLLYGWVGLTFFSYEQRQHWRKAFTLSQLAESLLLFVLLLLIVYFNLNNEVATTALLGIIGVVLAMRWYKLQTIFFGYSLGYIHGFLYFCTLEIMPFAGLWYALRGAEMALLAWF